MLYVKIGKSLKPVERPVMHTQRYTLRPDSLIPCFSSSSLQATVNVEVTLDVGT